MSNPYLQTPYSPEGIRTHSTVFWTISDVFKKKFLMVVGLTLNWIWGLGLWCKFEFWWFLKMIKSGFRFQSLKYPVISNIVMLRCISNSICVEKLTRLISIFTPNTRQLTEIFYLYIHHRFKKCTKTTYNQCRNYVLLITN